MMEPVMMAEENQRLALKPELSYFGAGQRTAAHEASVCVCVCPVIQSKQWLQVA